MTDYLILVNENDMQLNKLFIKMSEMKHQILNFSFSFRSLF